ncbi:MAG: hypothetical protein J2P28_18830, partial [Actinobacteria bacterium]|nr:hypothetical protein [Actinomycetota bacterium]
MSSKSRLTANPESGAASEAGAAPPVAGSRWLSQAASYGFSFWCLAATCALLPSYNIRWRIGPLPTDVLE